ncbi:hypothetical protein [Vampirovibrio sp.]|uniref:hypothetical protein n=1 Tax=Vampirovibrio sp. TaxID=2717857 RepID=UPI003593B54D
MAINPGGNPIHHPPLNHAVPPPDEPDITDVVNSILEKAYLDERLANNQDAFIRRSEAPEAEKLKMIAQSKRFREGNDISLGIKHNDNHAVMESVIRKLIRAGAGLNLDKQTTIHSAQDLEAWEVSATNNAKQKHQFTEEDERTLPVSLFNLPDNLSFKAFAYKQNVSPIPESITSQFPLELQQLNAKHEAVMADVYQQSLEKVKATPAELNQLGLTLDDLLINASREGYTHQIEPLLKAGAKVNGNPPDFTSNKFLTPATLAFKEGHVDTAKKLEELGGVNDYSDRFIKLMESIQQMSNKKSQAGKT